jgi:rhamnosyltransferase
MLENKTYISEDVTVIIPTRNGEGTLDKCLCVILKQNTLLKVEIIIIDSDSTDRTKAIADKYKTKYIHIEHKNYGHGKTRNQAASIASGESLVFLTQDAIPADENWLEPLIDGLKIKNVAGVYSRQIPNQGENLLEERKIVEEFGSLKEIRNNGYAKRNKYHFSNVSSAIKKEIWSKYPFDDAAAFAEDQLWAEKVIAAGYSILYEPKSRVYHSHNYSLRQRIRRSLTSPTRRVSCFKTMAAAGLEICKDWKYLLNNKNKGLCIVGWMLYAVIYRSVSGFIYWFSSLKYK